MVNVYMYMHDYYKHIFIPIYYCFIGFKLKPPSNFIAGRPKAALLFWLFGDFRCDVPLFIVILVTYKYSNR